MKVRILGKDWTLLFESPGVCLDGLTDPPTETGKTIRVRPGQDGEAELDTIIHEFTHAAQWNLKEEFVEEFARDLARLLRRLGYRRD